MEMRCFILSENRLVNLEDLKNIFPRTYFLNQLCTTYTYIYLHIYPFSQDLMISLDLEKAT